MAEEENLEIVDDTIDTIDVETPVENTETPDIETPVENETIEKPVEVNKQENSDETVPYHRFKSVYAKQKELERELQELKSQPANPTKEPASNQDSNEPIWEEYQAQGKTVEEFNKDYLKHNYTELRKAEKQEEAKISNAKDLEDRQLKASINIQQKATQAKAKFTDFVPVMQKAKEAGIGFSEEINLAIAENKNAGELAYNVFKDHSVAYELMSLPREQALIRIGEISASLKSGNSQPSKMTNMNPPVAPLSGGGKVSKVYHDKMSDAEFDMTFPPEF